MKIAVVGSRDFKNKELVEKVLAKELVHIENSVITGGARGVDTWAKEFCDNDCTDCEIIRPINPANKMDYLFRNVEIITKVGKVLAFWDGKSRGTKFVIDYARARKKDIEIIYDVVCTSDDVQGGKK